MTEGTATDRTQDRIDLASLMPPDLGKSLPQLKGLYL